MRGKIGPPETGVYNLFTIDLCTTLVMNVEKGRPLTTLKTKNYV